MNFFDSSVFAARNYGGYRAPEDLKIPGQLNCLAGAKPNTLERVPTEYSVNLVRMNQAHQ